jgi:hypothetical protein
MQSRENLSDLINEYGLKRAEVKKLRDKNNNKQQLFAQEKELAAIILAQEIMSATPAQKTSLIEAAQKETADRKKYYESLPNQLKTAEYAVGNLSVSINEKFQNELKIMQTQISSLNEVAVKAKGLDIKISKLQEHLADLDPQRFDRALNLLDELKNSLNQLNIGPELPQRKQDDQPQPTQTNMATQSAEIEILSLNAEINQVDAEMESLQKEIVNIPKINSVSASTLEGKTLDLKIYREENFLKEHRKALETMRKLVESKQGGSNFNFKEIKDQLKERHRDSAVIKGSLNAIKNEIDKINTLTAPHIHTDIYVPVSQPWKDIPNTVAGKSQVTPPLTPSRSPRETTVSSTRIIAEQMENKKPELPARNTVSPFAKAKQVEIKKPNKEQAAPKLPPRKPIERAKFTQGHFDLKDMLPNPTGNKSTLDVAKDLKNESSIKKGPGKS